MGQRVKTVCGQTLAWNACRLDVTVGNLLKEAGSQLILEQSNLWWKHKSKSSSLWLWKGRQELRKDVIFIPTLKSGQ